MMKKVLFLLVSAVLILATAAVSLAADVKVSGDCRYEVIQISDGSGENSVYDNADIRLNVDSEISDTVTARVTLRMISNNKDDNATPGQDDFFANAYWVKVKESFGEIKIGRYEYKIHPDRILAKACNNYQFIQSLPTMISANIPISGGLYGGLIYVIDGSSNNNGNASATGTLTGGYKLGDGAYDISLGYKGEYYGAVVHYFETKVVPAYNAMSSGWAFDVYYDLSQNCRIFAYGTRPDYDFEYSQYDDEVMLGLKFTDLLGTKLTASLEYDVTGRTETSYDSVTKIYTTNDWEQAPYAVKLIYPLKNKLQLELEHINTTYTNDVQNLLRLKVLF